MHTFSYRGQTFDIEKIIEATASYPVTQINIIDLIEQVAEPVWDDARGRQLRPLTVLQYIQRKRTRNSLHSHIDRVKKADLRYPVIILVIDGYLVMVDGMHRLCKHICIGQRFIQARLVTPLEMKNWLIL